MVQSRYYIVGNSDSKGYKMGAIAVWTVVVLWCIAVLFLVSLPFVFTAMFLMGKGELAKSWWLAIKPRRRANGSYKIEHPNYLSDAKYSFLPTNIYYHK